MAKSDRIFGLVVVLVALAYIASATQIKTSFLSDPVGAKAFPMLVGSVAALCGFIMIWRPDEEPEWPELRTLGALAVSVVVLLAYAFLLKPLGFLVPTAIVAGVLSYQINPRAIPAAIAGVGLSVGLFTVFKFILGLGLVGLPRALFG